MREAITAAAALGLSLTLSSAAVVAAERDNYAIESQPLASALREFARQTGIQVAAQTELTAGKRSSELIGQYTASDALLTLLRGTGLTACKVNEKTFGIRALTSGAKPESVEDCGTMRRATQLEQTSLRQETSNSASSSGPAQEVPSELYVEEVLVTAQKRTERAQDVPVPVSVLTADSLARGNALRLQDYSARVPGLNFTPGLASQQILAIRGVSTGTGTNPTVGVMIDDVPFGSTSNIGGGNAVPDLDPSDLARIEVLRGPQGTLYGANSIGGLLKFVTLDPSTEGFSGKLQTGISHVRNGDDLGYSARASVNVPLSETFAIRASGFGRQDPGYVDDPVQGRQGVNSADVYGGQASALWRISQAWSLKLGALAQRTEGDGRADSEPLLGDLMQRRLPGSGGYDKQVQAYSATLSADLGNAQLISVSGYNKNRSSDALDAGFIYASQVQPRFGTSAAILESDFDSSRFTQEVRVSMSLSSKVEWLIGGFYTDEDRRGVQTIFAADSATGAPIGLLRSTDSPNTYEEYAAFTNVTLQLTDRFDVQLGGRYSENEQSYRQAQVGVGATVSGNQPKRTTEADAFTYLVTPRFMFSPDLMVYARVASGYRPGGPNGDPLTPPQYQPSRLRRSAATSVVRRLVARPYAG